MVAMAMIRSLRIIFKMLSMAEQAMIALWALAAHKEQTPYSVAAAMIRFMRLLLAASSMAERVRIILDSVPLLIPLSPAEIRSLILARAIRISSICAMGLIRFTQGQAQPAIPPLRESKWGTS